MEEYLDDFVQVLLAILVSIEVLESGRWSVRMSSKSFIRSSKNLEEFRFVGL